MADGATFSIVFPALTGFLGTVVGAGVTYWLQRSQRTDDRADKRRALAAGIAAELIAFIDLVEERDHTAMWRKIIASMQAGTDYKFSGGVSPAGKVKDLFPFFFAQLGDIGLLGDQAAELARFYTRLSGIYATLLKANRGSLDHLALPDRIRIIEIETDLWENTLRGGRAVAIQLQAIGQAK